MDHGVGALEHGRELVDGVRGTDVDRVPDGGAVRLGAQVRQPPGDTDDLDAGGVTGGVTAA